VPYITKGQRGRYDHAIMLLMKDLEGSPIGDVNYVITRILVKRLGKKYGYTELNEVVGLISSVKTEFERQVVAPYEDQKRSENGDVY